MKTGQICTAQKICNHFFLWVLHPDLTPRVCLSTKYYTSCRFAQSYSCKCRKSNHMFHTFLSQIGEETPIFVELWFFLQILDISSNEKQWISVILIFDYHCYYDIITIIIVFYNNNDHYYNLIFLLLSFWSPYIIIFNCIVCVQHSQSLNKNCTSDTPICSGAHTIGGVNQISLLIFCITYGFAVAGFLKRSVASCTRFWIYSWMHENLCKCKVLKYWKFLLVIFPLCVVVSSNFLDFHL